MADLTLEEQLRKIVADHAATEIEGVLVDAFTAHMLCKVIDALKQENKEKFLLFPIVQMAEIGWRLVN